MNSDGELELVNSSSSSSSPGGYNHTLPNDQQDTIIRDRSSAVSAFDMSANLDTSMRKRAVHRHSSSSGKRFSMGSDDDDEDDNSAVSANRKEERDQTPTLASTTTSAPPNLTRSNSLGLGFGDTEFSQHASSNQATKTSDSSKNLQKPSMYIASSSQNGGNQRVTSADDLVKVSPAPSTASSSNLEDDDAIFNEAKEST